ncbi:MAG: hypothetical protein IPK26_26670 [Planctomycetes bacterium]|nr:hypothetical protein [Planctomycetota bacterium]
MANTADWLENQDSRVAVSFVPNRPSAGSSGPLPAEALAEVEHQGPLAGEDLEALKRSAQEYTKLRADVLTKFSAQVQANNPEQIAEEANLLAILQIAIAAEDAIARGAYLTLTPPKTLMRLPGCDLLSTSTTRDGKPINIVAVMPLERYPALRDARQYQGETNLVAAQEVAHRFNSKNDGERARLAARRQEIERRRAAGQTPSVEEIQFLYTEMGLALPLRLDPVGNLMIVEG